MYVYVLYVRIRTLNLIKQTYLTSTSKRCRSALSLKKSILASAKYLQKWIEFFRESTVLSYETLPKMINY
jgi:hypothetical protein